MQITEVASGAMWQRLRGKIAEPVFMIPYTWKTSTSHISPLAVPDSLAQYLNDVVVGAPWANHLALITAVLSLRGLTIGSIHAIQLALHAHFRALFQELELKTMSKWKAQSIIPAYLKGEILSEDPKTMRLTFWRRYSSATRNVREWLETLSPEDQRPYQPYILPVLDIPNARPFIRQHGEERRTQQLRQIEAAYELGNLSAIRAAAQLRHNQVRRLREAYREIQQLVQGNNLALPVSFSYEEEALTLQGRSRVRWWFRIWDRRSFVLHHRGDYSATAVSNATKRHTASVDAQSERFLEFLRAEPVSGDIALEPWFVDLLRRDVLGENAGYGTTRLLAAKQQWLRDQGYSDDETAGLVTPFRVRVPGLFAWPSENSLPRFIGKAQQLTEGVLIPIDSLFAVATFGALALDLITTAGMRLEDFRRLRLNEDVLVRFELPMPEGEQTRPVRYIAHLRRTDEPDSAAQDYFLSAETQRLMRMTLEMLADHYACEPDQLLPSARTIWASTKMHPSPDAPYLFQYQYSQLPEMAIAACMRFLLHAAVYYEASGKPRKLSPDIFTEALATIADATQPPIDIIGRWLEQPHHQDRNPGMTGQPTDKTDAFLSHVARLIDVEAALDQSSAELQQAYAQARRRAGIWSDVLGGHCTAEACCATTFASLGCARKVVDPARRHQVERYRQWAVQEMEIATREDLWPQVEMLRQIIEGCDFDLQRMDQINEYLQDAARRADIHIAAA